ncbi:TonB family protein [Pelomonas sp. V22]|uniref:energy transducer TonB n=1 Tax=Pelomonas sp. V22 TaxID=2822139 RepID=UPI0024A91141|nr:energy transducer TonB [Pelomonas sp. V22]MDI4634998.1 TonB family protein [Pelomonas sp. V22]
MKHCIRMGTGLGLAWALCGAALAQSNAPVVVTPAAKPALTPEERAKRDADKVFHWIRMNADKAPAPKPVAAAAPKPAAKPVAVAAAAAPKAASRAVVDAAPETSAPPTVVAVSDNTSVASREIEPPPQVALAVPRSEPVPAPAVAAPAQQAEPELQLLNRVAPEFPRQLANTITSGSVMVRFMVQPDGSVRNAEALKSSHRKLTVAALDAVNQWRFAPVSSPREATVEIGFSRGE